METTRYLTKSRFKLATECPTKLFYADKGEYANQNLDDSFLLALAEGGFQVSSLARCYFSDGHHISPDNNEAIMETKQLLQEDQITIYEAAIAIDNLFIRADILVKKGNCLHFYEVKSKSFDSTEGNPFVNQNGTIKALWKPYLYDVAFQKYVIGKAYPNYNVMAYLMMSDKSVACPTDGLNQKFRIVKNAEGKKSVNVSDTITDKDLSTPILRAVNVDEECIKICDEKVTVGTQSLDFAQRVNFFASKYALDQKVQAPITTKCSSCEFHTIDSDEQQEGLKSGKKECWQALLGWDDEEFKCPTVLDIWNLNPKRKSQLIEAGSIKIMDISKEDIKPVSDNKPGMFTSERQWMQVQKCQNQDNSIWIDRKNLQDEINRWTFPLHFIDFESITTAIPFNAGRRPYELMAFQFSHHIVYDNGSIEHIGQYLNTEPGVFPNYEFVRELKQQLENDNGTIFRYAPHENTILNTIYHQILNDQEDIPDGEALCQFIKSITRAGQKSEEQWTGERNMVDMWEIVKRYYYDPATNGSNSIKQVFPAILNSSPFLKDKYSNPIYGSDDGIPSQNFTNWQWIKYDKCGKIIDPYKRLPKMFQDISDKDMCILTDDDLRDGGAAMMAYARIQFEEMSDYERQEVCNALLKYCELDTMAMVMIYEGWKDLLQ